MNRSTGERRSTDERNHRYTCGICDRYDDELRRIVMADRSFILCLRCAAVAYKPDIGTFGDAMPSAVRMRTVLEMVGELRRA